MSKALSIDNILAGWKNFLWPNDYVKKVAHERLEKCRPCKYNKLGACALCKCPLAGLTRSMLSYCPDRKWDATSMVTFVNKAKENPMLMNKFLVHRSTLERVQLVQISNNVERMQYPGLSVGMQYYIWLYLGFEWCKINPLAQKDKFKTMKVAFLNPDEDYPICNVIKYGNSWLKRLDRK